jgi:hypothetical protein
MLTLAEFALALSVLWTGFVVFVNLMARAELRHPLKGGLSIGLIWRPFHGGWMLLVCWLVTAGLFLWWGVH